MMEFKEQWNLGMAMEVLASPNVDGEVWSEAVKWLLLYGPPRIKEILEQASSHAFNEYLPQLQPRGYGDDGQAYYDLGEIAAALGVEEDEVAARLAELQFEEGVEVFVEGDRVYKLH
ncbi:MAG: hypothetical protein RQ753_03945 [Desulfurivibrionaceae bacterium]|nr:hypothetical protein [Desulfobulbales bacterium]MDT8334828.1 hypothetical protein [Desulfurivibrionaceae bacterium]